MSDQPNPTPPSAPATAPTNQSLDDILNQLEKATGTNPSTTETVSPSPAPPTQTQPPISPEPSEPPPVMPETPAMATPIEEPAALDTTAVTSEPSPATEPPVTEPPVGMSMTEPMGTQGGISMPEQTPVATVPETEMPAPPAVEPTPSAEIVKEEPVLDMASASPSPMPEVSQTPTPQSEPVAQAQPTTTAPEMPAVPETPATPTAPPPAQAGSGNAGKIIAGVIGVFLLLGAAGAGIYLTGQPQETRAPATQANVPVGTPFVVEVPKQTAKVSGKICPANATQQGSTFFYNTSEKVVLFQPVATGATTYTQDLAPGQYLAVFRPEGSDKYVGYTEATECSKTQAADTCTDHTLKTFVVGETESVTNIDLCDESVDRLSLPQENYKLATP